MLIFSVSSLADDLLREKLRTICHDQDSRLFIPHGAILGLDGVFDGRDIIEKVSITTTKNPRNLGLKGPEKGVLYDGPTRGACYKFPRNVNVHAALAVTGLGFDKTRSIVIADPDSSHMVHEIHVEGPGLMWDIRISSQSVGVVSGSYTPVSAARTVERILNATYDIVLI
jgi:aspartate dehydrogenase